MLDNGESEGVLDFVYPLLSRGSDLRNGDGKMGSTVRIRITIAFDNDSRDASIRLAANEDLLPAYGLF